MSGQLYFPADLFQGKTLTAPSDPLPRPTAQLLHCSRQSVTNCMKQSCAEADSSSSSHEALLTLWHPNTRHHNSHISTIYTTLSYTQTDLLQVSANLVAIFRELKFKG
jgi:hypothetical protein